MPRNPAADHPVGNRSRRCYAHGMNARTESDNVLGPERSGGQGLDPNQDESGNRAILALLRDPAVADHVDLVITHRDDAYEVWAVRGMVRFQRVRANGSVA